MYILQIKNLISETCEHKISKILFHQFSYFTVDRYFSAYKDKFNCVVKM